jgi:hypothetical protein
VRVNIGPVLSIIGDLLLPVLLLLTAQAQWC